MPKDKTESHERIQRAAREEFPEKGFENASMREIGSKAGLTHSGLYRRCPSKEAMFSSLADPFIEDMMAGAKQHRDELKLIICCSHGTKYENFINELVWAESEETLKAFEYIRHRGIPVKPVTADEIHVLLSAYMTAVPEPIAHRRPEEKALRCLDLVEEFFIPAWKSIMGFQKGK